MGGAGERPNLLKPIPDFQLPGPRGETSVTAAQASPVYGVLLRCPELSRRGCKGRGEERGGQTEPPKQHMEGMG